MYFLRKTLLARSNLIRSQCRVLSQRELYEKSIELNKFYIDTGLMNDRTLADFRLDLLPPLFELFENYQISKEETGEIISGEPELINRNLSQLTVDFEFWNALLSEKDYHHHITKYPTAAFYSGSESYQDNRLELAKLLSNEVGLNTKMIGRIIAGTPEFFDSEITWATEQLTKLKKSYDRLSGTNFQMFCRVQFGQSIRLLDRPEAFDELIDELFRLDFQKSEILKIMPKLAGVLAELNMSRIGDMHKVLNDRLGIDSQLKLKMVYQTSPNLLSLGFATLQARLDCLIDEHGFEQDDLRRNPAVLELTPAIIRYRYNRLKPVSNEIDISDLIGTKADWERHFEKFAKRANAKRHARPLFSPTEMTFIKESDKVHFKVHHTQQFVDGEITELKHKMNGEKDRVHDEYE